MGLSIKAQNQKCSTMEKLEQLKAQDPTLQARMDALEIATQEWILKNRNYPVYDNVSSTKAVSIQKGFASPNPCPYDNFLYLTWAAPSVVGDSVTDNCFWGGDYATVTGMIAGNTYRILTCGGTAFDTEISVYTSGGVTAVAYNDDFCGSQSSILFTPINSGNYDVLIDVYPCDTNSNCMDLTVKLIATPRPVITIPVVVHVVYNVDSAQQNISDAQIFSQMDILNEDFRRLNADLITNAPPVFRGVSKDPLIEFCLAQRDPDGDPTTGITRTATTHGPFTADDIYYDSLGGKNIWDRDRYMNIWVMDNGSAGGWAWLPGTAPEGWDGMGIHYTSFGNIGTAAPPFPGGRTAVHEVGHWLNLEHMWGNAPCGDDFVYDTPQQNQATDGGCPVFPVNPNICTNTGLAGEMVMNFMDYNDDDCYAMFTYGQTERMDDALFGIRDSLRTSRGCLPCPAITASFTSSNTTICEGETINFTNTSTGASIYEWDEDYITFSTSTNASRTFNTEGTYLIDLWAYDQYIECGDFTSVTITVNVCTGILDLLTDNNIKIYPNPSSDEFTIEMDIFETQNIEVKIINVLGQEIYNEKLNHYKGFYRKLIDSKGYTNGVYLVKIKLDNKIITKKLTIVK